MNEKRIAFVINPVAGGKKKENIIQLISENLSDKTAYDIFVWEEKNNFGEIQKQITSGKYQTVVAVGGDGTVNEVAKNLISTGINFGIIPRGSGNGLARTLGIPMDTKKALQLIETGKIKTIDCGYINGKPFFCTSGIGFDAHIGKLFAQSKKRGLSSYFKITTQQLLKYRAKNYTISADANTFTGKAFLITFANAGQYGNDFYIAPEAKVDDGMIHVAIMKPFSVLSVWPLLVKIMRKRAHTSRKIMTFTTQSLKIQQTQPDAIHFDGEPGVTGKNEIEVKILPAVLKIIC
jgi:diacylglycerol kinase (ATP)